MKGKGHTINCQSSYMTFELNNNLVFCKKKKIRNITKRESEKKKCKNKQGHKV